MLAVVCAGRVGDNLADALMHFVHINRKLVAMMALAMLEQLSLHTIEDGLGTCFANPILIDPNRGAVGDGTGMDQTAELLVAHPIQ